MASLQPACPYCNKALGKAPKRSMACPHCGKSIYVRKAEAVTKDEADVRDWLVHLSQVDVERKQFDKVRAELSKKLGLRASVNDTVWSLLNNIVAKTRDFQLMRSAYYAMARVLSLEGKSTKPMVAEALRAHLMYLKQLGVKTVIVQCYGGQIDYSTCPACMALHGKLYPIDKALKELPVPTACTCEQCRCSYENQGSYFDLLK